MASARDSLSPLGQAALAYALKDWHVFPCQPRGKRPLSEHGLKDASRVESTIRAWWTRWPAANIGHPTGLSVVVDVDGGQGEASLKALQEKHGALPTTREVRTGK